jgi:hypothetical protein
MDLNIKGWVVLIAISLVMIVCFGAVGIFSTKKVVEKGKCIKWHYNLYGEEIYKTEC